MDQPTPAASLARNAARSILVALLAWAALALTTPSSTAAQIAGYKCMEGNRSGHVVGDTVVVSVPQLTINEQYQNLVSATGNQILTLVSLKFTDRPTAESFVFEVSTRVTTPGSADTPHTKKTTVYYDGEPADISLGAYKFRLIRRATGAYAVVLLELPPYDPSCP